MRSRLSAGGDVWQRLARDNPALPNLRASESAPIGIWRNFSGG